jgi:hypothetical protein
MLLYLKNYFDWMLNVIKHLFASIEMIMCFPLLISYDNKLHGSLSKLYFYTYYIYIYNV